MMQRMAFGCLNVGIRARAALTTAVARKCYSMAYLTSETASEAVSFVARCACAHARPCAGQLCCLCGETGCSPWPCHAPILISCQTARL